MQFRSVIQVHDNTVYQYDSAMKSYQDREWKSTVAGATALIYSYCTVLQYCSTPYCDLRSQFEQMHTRVLGVQVYDTATMTYYR